MTLAQPTTDTVRIKLKDEDLRRLQMVWNSRWRRAPTDEEFQGLIEEEVHEEVLYCEALGLGLEKGDPVIKRYLAHKMRLMVEDLAALRKQDPEQIKAWYQENCQRFALSPRASFHHIFFSFDRRQARTRQDAAAALSQIAGEPSDAAGNEMPGDPSTYFQPYYGDRNAEEVEEVFGSNFAEALFELKPRAWQGPIESGFGWHLVWIDAITPGRIPSFEEVEPQVESAFRLEQRKETQQKYYEAVQARYEIELPAAFPALRRAAPMSAAPFQFRADGTPDWGQMWTTFCELALYGGPPHRGEQDALSASVDPQPVDAQAEAVKEMIRGIYETTGLVAEPAEPGWIAVQSHSRKMAAWLCATIIMENVEARCEGERLLLPASSDFTLTNQVKSIITVIAKTNHYWQAHIAS